MERKPDVEADGRAEHHRGCRERDCRFHGALLSSFSFSKGILRHHPDSRCGISHRPRFLEENLRRFIS